MTTVSPEVMKRWRRTTMQRDRAEPKGRSGYPICKSQFCCVWNFNQPIQG